MFGNLGVWEILMIVVVVMLLFGAKRLPEIGASLGKGITAFKRSLSDTQDAVLKQPEEQQLPKARQLDAPPAGPPGGGEPKRLSQ